MLSYGLLYSLSADDLNNYVCNARHGLFSIAYGATVREYPYRSSESGLLTLNSSFAIRFNRIKENRPRAAAAHIRYELDGTLYEEFSEPAAVAIADGYINGIGPTIVDAGILADPR